MANVVDRTSFGAMRERAVAADAVADGASPFRDGAKTFFHKGTNGRWRDVLTDAEPAMYEQTKADVLSPDCARAGWRMVAWDWPSKSRWKRTRDSCQRGKCRISVLHDFGSREVAKKGKYRAAGNEF